MKVFYFIKKGGYYENFYYNTQPFQLWIEDLGVFPNEKKPNILWTGVKGELDNLEALYNKLKNNIEKRKLPFDAKIKYTPHVTLAKKIGSGYKKNNLKIQTSKWEVNSLEVYKSMFTSNGVKYQRIFSKKLSFEE